ncbi:zinc finger CCCH domain-containing protein 13-like [Tachysurus ichikawai]
MRRKEGKKSDRKRDRDEGKFDFIANDSLFPPTNRRHGHGFPAPASLRDESFGGLRGKDEVLESNKKKGSKKRRDGGRAGGVERL